MSGHEIYVGRLLKKFYGPSSHSFIGKANRSLDLYSDAFSNELLMKPYSALQRGKNLWSRDEGDRWEGEGGD